jgi:hypothetical protein
MFINFANYYVLIPVLIVTVILLVMGYKTKRSIYPLITLLSYTALIIIHFLTKSHYSNIWFNLMVDITGIIISISTYLIVDEIEIRREKISEVFVNKYRKD